MSVLLSSCMHIFNSILLRCQMDEFDMFVPPSILYFIFINCRVFCSQQKLSIPSLYSKFILYIFLQNQSYRRLYAQDWFKFSGVILSSMLSPALKTTTSSSLKVPSFIRHFPSSSIYPFRFFHSIYSPS